MKKLLARIRNKKLKGNISLLVILILLASSVISLLSINQIQRLLTYWNMTFNYFRAFYLAKAWMELWLTEVYNSWDGFTHSISGDNGIIQDNLVWIYTWFDPYFKMSITWEFLYLTDDIRESNECKEENKIKLATWAWIMLSLFSDDNGKEGLHTILSDNVGNKKLQNIGDLSLEWNVTELTFAFFTYKYYSDPEIKDYVMEDIIVRTWNNLKTFLSTEEVSSLITNDNNVKEYLTIKNSWDQPVEFCVTMDNKPIPYSNFLVTVFWHYGDMEVWIQSIIKKWVPDWTLNVLDKFGSS